MAGIPWAESYLGQLRAAAGDKVLLFVGARTVVRDEAGRILLIKRSDNGAWALPAGAMEVGESITDCAIRELYEETGLTAVELTPYALYTDPQYTHRNMYGHTYQLFVLAYRVERWTGELQRVTDETTDARFFGLDELPPEVGPMVHLALDDLAAFERAGERLVVS